MDTLAYVASTLSLVFTADQLRIIWIGHNASGVSPLAWFFYTVSSSVWLMYGYVHKEKVLLITHSVWVVMSSLIFLGILLYR